MLITEKSVFHRALARADPQQVIIKVKGDSLREYILHLLTPAVLQHNYVLQDCLCSEL